MSTASGNILVIDDDVNITDLLSVNLRSEGYTVEVATCAEDVDRTGLDDTRLVIDIKDDPATEHIGIILYSTIKSERMVIDALDAGADDYITKPFSLRELVARVKSVLRRHAPRPGRNNAAVTFHGLSLDPGNMNVKLDGKPLPLSRTEFAILSILLKNLDNYVPRAEIHRRVWGADNAGDNERVVDTNISRLRKKLGDLGSHIISRTGLGYMIS